MAQRVPIEKTNGFASKGLDITDKILNSTLQLSIEAN